jgi:sugar phosphate isomerase/epimerase
MRFAVCLWDFEPEASLVGSLRASGVTALEPGADFLTRHDDAAIEAVGGWCRSAGIDIHACHAPFGGENDLSLLDEGARQQAVARVEQALARAASMGAACVVVHPSSGGISDEDRAERRAQLVRSLASLIGASQRIGIRLALENMLPHHIGDTGAEIMAIVNRFDSPQLGVCLDVGHAHLNPEGVMGAFRVLRERIITFHLQDNDGNNDRHLQPPYGTIDWAAFARACRPQEFQFPWSVEAPTWKGADWSVMLREMQALFSEGLLAVPLGDVEVNAICRRCGRYVFGTAEASFCGCDHTSTLSGARDRASTIH